MNEPKFKVGQQVRSTAWGCVGKITRITVAKDGYSYEIKSEDGGLIHTSEEYVSEHIILTNDEIIKEILEIANDETYPKCERIKDIRDYIKKEFEARRKQK